MKTLDDTVRARIARGWSTTSLSQERYAAEHGISARTLREWVRVYGSGDRPVARAMAIIDHAIAQLQALRAAVDAEEAFRVGAECASQEVVGTEPERHAQPAVKLTAAPAGPAEPVMRPTRRGGYFASMNDEP